MPFAPGSAGTGCSERGRPEGSAPSGADASEHHVLLYNQHRSAAQRDQLEQLAHQRRLDELYDPTKTEAELWELHRVARQAHQERRAAFLQARHRPLPKSAGPPSHSTAADGAASQLAGPATPDSAAVSTPSGLNQAGGSLGPGDSAIGSHSAVQQYKAIYDPRVDRRARTLEMRFRHLAGLRPRRVAFAPVATSHYALRGERIRSSVTLERVMETDRVGQIGATFARAAGLPEFAPLPDAGRPTTTTRTTPAQLPWWDRALVREGSRLPGPGPDAVQLAEEAFGCALECVDTLPPDRVAQPDVADADGSGEARGLERWAQRVLGRRGPSCPSWAGGLDLEEITSLVVHPTPFSFQEEPDPPHTTYLTAAERRRLRRLRRLERQRERLRAEQHGGLLGPGGGGLLAAPRHTGAPRVTLRNYLRIFAQEAIQDPSAVEFQVRASVAARAAAAQATSQAGALTPGERRRKRLAKRRADALRTRRAIFRFARTLRAYAVLQLQRAVSDWGARGAMVVSPHWTILVIEGGPRSVRFMANLLFRRLGPSLFAASATGGGGDGPSAASKTAAPSGHAPPHVQAREALVTLARQASMVWHGAVRMPVLPYGFTRYLARTPQQLWRVLSALGVPDAFFAVCYYDPKTAKAALPCH